MVDVREKAKAYIDRIPAAGLSSKDNPQQFESFVGKAPAPQPGKKGYTSRQEQMEASGYKMTFCNEFAGEFGRAMTGTYMGALDLRTFILKTHDNGKKAYSWVNSDSGQQPKIGDILYSDKPHPHLGVSRGVENGKLLKVEAGQGGKNYQQDFLKFTDSKWAPSDYIGWIDIDLFVNGKKGLTELSPVGKWTVLGDKKRYRWAYAFEENGKVRWFDIFNGMHGDGVWNFQGEFLFINWFSGSYDKWKLPVNFEKMTGSETSKGEGTIDIEASKQ
jgi:hypothetical protein